MGSVSSVRRITLGGLSALALSGILVTSTSTQVFGDSGCPTAVAPTLVSGSYEIDTAAKLQWLRQSVLVSGAMSNTYKLTADINMVGCTWTAGIGSASTPFSGVFDGNSKTISNLTVTSNNNAGMFLSISGTVRDFTLASPTVSGGNIVGALTVDVTSGGTVNNVSVTSVSVTATSQVVGGAIGRVSAGGTATQLSVSGTVSAQAGVGGGVAGVVSGTMTNVSSSATVTGTFNLGGLVGNVSGGTLTTGTATGNVTGTLYKVGGAVGTASGTRPTCATITGVTASGEVRAQSQVGGIVGYGDCAFIYQSSSSSTVVATQASGLAGAGGVTGFDNSAGRIEKSFFTGSVTGSESVGGIAGYSRSIIIDSYSSGTVTATSATNGGKAGGLVGVLRNSEVAGTPNAEITRTYARGLVTPPTGGASTTGGLVGSYMSGTITASAWDIETTGQTSSQGTGARGYSSQQLKDYVLYDPDNLNWGNITDGISSGNGVTSGTTWSICSGTNSGYPFLTLENRAGTCRPTMAYYGNGQTSGSEPTDSGTPYTAGSTVTVSGNTGNLAKTSKVFAGWNTKADGTGVTYVQGDTFVITSPVMLFAVWADSPQVAYNANGGSGTVAATPGSSGATVTLSTGSGLTRTGFMLARWDTSSLGTGTSYSKGQSVTMPAGGLALHAVWTALPAVTYNANLGSGSIANQYDVSGATVTLSTGSGLTRTGFTLSRWDTLADGTGTSYSLSQVISMPVGGLSLYGVWVADPPSTMPNATTTTTVPATPCPEEAPPPRVGRLSVTCPAILSPSTGASTTTTTTPRTSTTIRSSVTSGLASSSSTSTSTTLPSTTLPSTTLPSTTTTSPTKTPAPDVPGVVPGDTGATVGGRPVEATVTHEGGDLVVVVEDATIRYSVTKPNGEKQPIPVGGSFVLLPGSEISVRMLGLASVGRSEVWVTPDGLRLGDVELENGEGSIIGVVPDDVAGGDSRLVVKSETSTGEPLVVAYGVTVQKQKSSGASWSVVLFVIMGLAVVSGLFIPAARRRRDDDEEEEVEQS